MIANVSKMLFTRSVEKENRNIIERRWNIEQSEPGIIIPDRKFACFPAFTPITMADKKHKSIEEIQVGDEILSLNVLDNSIATGIVNEVKMFDVSEYIIINEKLYITPSHKILTDQNGSISSLKVSHLCLKYKIVSENGQRVQVTSLKLEEKPIKVYNLLIDGNKSFFASGFAVGDFLSKMQFEGEKSFSDDEAREKRKELRERLLHGK